MERNFLDAVSYRSKYGKIPINTRIKQKIVSHFKLNYMFLAKLKDIQNVRTVIEITRFRIILCCTRE